MYQQTNVPDIWQYNDVNPTWHSPNSPFEISFAQTLQKKNSSGSWSTVKTWSKTVNDYSYTYTNKYSGLAKGTYRVKTSATVYSGNKSEVVTSYSAEKTVK